MDSSASTEQPPLTAAEQLMRKHHQSYDEIRSDNNSLNNNNNQSDNLKPTTTKKKQPDLDSETAFPSLGTPAPIPSTVAGWGASPALSPRPLVGPFNKTNLAHISQFTETLVLLLASIHIGPVPTQYREKGLRSAGEKREEDPKTLPDVLRVVQKRHPTVTLESSTSRDRVTIIFRTPLALPTPTSSTPLLIKAATCLAPEERVIRARQELITRVTRKIEKVIKIPGAVKPFVIGQRGRVLKEIIDITGASINLPPKDGTTPTMVDGQVDESELIPITIQGEESAVLDAEDRIMMIVREHTNKVNLKIFTIPTEFYPLLNRFLLSKRSESDANILQNGLINELHLQDVELNCHVNIPSIDQVSNSSPSHISLSELDSNHPPKGLLASATKDPLPITVSGDRQQAEYAANFIQSTYQNIVKSTTKVELELPKRQHKFLDNRVIEQILESTGSIVILPPPTDLSEKVVIRGENMSNVQALGLVVQKANEFQVESLDLKAIHPKLADPSGYARSLVTYLSTKIYQTKLKQIQDDYSPKGIKIYVPICSSASFSTTIEITGRDLGAMKEVGKVLESYIGTTIKAEYFVTLQVDQLLHGYLLRKKNPRLKVILDHHGIEIILPIMKDETDPGSSTILLVATKPIITAGSKDKIVNHEELILNLSKAKDEILRSIKELSEIKSAQVSIPSNLQDRILGPNQTTLNVMIGEDKLVQVLVDKPLGESSEVVIGIRGPKGEVERVENEINRMIEEAKVTEAVNSYSTEFEIDSKLVSHLVGKGGSAVSKLGEELAVRVLFADQPGSTPNDDNHHHHHNNTNGVKKSKKNQHAKVLVTIFGRLENVEEAKKRILAQAERLADEVTITVPLIAGLDRGALIGKGGMYITRLQDTHMVHINMPRSRKVGESGGSDRENEITIRGPRKGVEAVKREFVELMEYEREQGNVVSIEIPTRAVSRIVGRGGAQASKIKDDSGLTSLDIDKIQGSDAAGGLSRVTMKGSKAAINAAKKSIHAIVQEVDDECSVEIKIPRTHHQTLIGRGGARLRELVKMAGADESATKMIHFSRSTSEGEAADLVEIRGDKATVGKIQGQLEQELKRLVSQVVQGVQVPKSAQPGLIGRAASGIKALQSKYNVAIFVPGWSQYASIGPPANLSDLADAQPDEIFKIAGDSLACSDAIKDLKSKIVVRGDRPDRAHNFKQSIAVPAQYHHLFINNLKFDGVLSKGVRIDHGSVAVPDPFKARAENGRIDVEENGMDGNRQPVILSWDAQELSLGGLQEVPWNISGVGEEVKKVVKWVESRTGALTEGGKSGAAGGDGKVYLATSRVRPDKMKTIIGKAGTGLRTLIEKANGTVWVEVVGKSNSDTLLVLGSLSALNFVKGAWSQISH